VEVEQLIQIERSVILLPILFEVVHDPFHGEAISYFVVSLTVGVFPSVDDTGVTLSVTISGHDLGRVVLCGGCGSCHFQIKFNFKFTMTRP
jgi:hypothetical protein